jgi:hypothetical protein
MGSVIPVERNFESDSLHSLLLPQMTSELSILSETSFAALSAPAFLYSAVISSTSILKPFSARNLL